MSLFRPRPAPDPYSPQHALEAGCARLRQQYQERTPLPAGYSVRTAGYALDDGLSMAQLTRLFRAIRFEHLGE